MRKLPLLIGLLACTALTGCDWWHKAPPQAVACHCTAPVAAPAQTETTRELRSSQYAATGERYATPPSYRPVRRHAGTRHRSSQYAYRHHAFRQHGYNWSERQAERSVDSYGYSSSSRSYGGSGYGYGYGRGGDCCGGGAGGAQFSGTTRVWADGYGRRHIYDQSAVRHYAYQAHVRRTGEGAADGSLARL